MLDVTLGGGLGGLARSCHPAAPSGEERRTKRLSRQSTGFLFAARNAFHEIGGVMQNLLNRYEAPSDYLSRHEMTPGTSRHDSMTRRIHSQPLAPSFAKCRAFLLATLFLLPFTGCENMKPANPAVSKAATPEPGRTQPRTFECQTVTKADYLLFLPRDYQSGTGKRWPLIFFLHGAGERGTNVSQVATHGPLKYAAAHPDFPFIVVAPQCPSDEQWSDEVLLRLLDGVLRDYAVDSHRVYLTGLSMGGFGAWHFGIAHPERFAALAPMCGGGEWITAYVSYHRDPKSLQSLPVWAFHGAKDDVVPLAESERMVRLLTQGGCRDVQLTIDPEANHDCWTKAYSNPALYDWFLQHQRSSDRPSP
jgi:predicted esterase